MNQSLIRTGLLLFAFLSVGCLSTRINAYPDYLGYTGGQKIIFSPYFKWIDQPATEHYIEWTDEKFKKKLPSLAVANYLDAEYSGRQYGITLSAVDSSNAKELKLVYEHLKIDYMLIVKGIQVDSNYDEYNNPSYLSKQATLQMQLLDFKNGIIVWKSETRVSLNPAEIDGELYNVRSTGGALSKAYRKSIKRLIKSSHLIQVK